MILLIVLFLIVFEAVHEALYDNNKKLLSGIIESIYLMVITSIVLLWVSGIFLIHLPYIPFIKVVIGYLCLRFAVFDVIYNLLRSLPVFYIGNTKLYDKLLRIFSISEPILAICKIVLLIIGILLII